MVKRFFNPLIARFAAVAALLALALAAPAVFAQEADPPPCTVDQNTGAVSCNYDENGTDAVADFSAMDPEGEDIDWGVEGPDKGLFDITGGVLTFKNSPDFENPKDGDNDPEDQGDQGAGDNVYEVMVRATELLAEGQDPPAKSSMLDVTVTVKDVEEPGSIDLSRLQPQTGVVLTATLSDSDQGQDPANRRAHTNVVWLWEVPKVSRPVLENDAHWQTAGAQITTAAEYTPAVGDVNDFLRVKVTYQDAEGASKKAYKRSYHAVRLAPTGTNTEPDFDEATITLTIPESAAVGTTVGTPIAATDPDRGDITTYVLTGTDEFFFKINKMTGQLTIGVKLDAERSTGGNDEYTVTVTAYDPSNVPSSPAATVNIRATDVNEAPDVVLAPNTTEMLKVDENHALVVPDPNPGNVAAIILGTYDADDQDIGDGAATADSSQVKLSLEGDDADAFDLSDPSNAGDPQQLQFKKSPNFESPIDANQDNVYKVTVVATDKKGLTGMRALTIEVMNVDEAGDISFSSIQPGVGEPLTASISDLDGGITGTKWQWYRSNLEAGPYTEIDGATSATYTPAARVEDNLATLGINEEDNGDEGMFLQVTVMYRDNASDKVDDPDTADDETKVLNQEVTEEAEHAVRAVPKVNRPPAFDSATMTREVNENETGNVGDPVEASDPDEDTLNYTITGGADIASFGIGLGSGQITVKEGTKLDAEGKTSYEVEVTAMDPFGRSDSTMVTIMVLNVNEAPDFEADDPDNYAENGTGPVATFTATDPEGAGIDWSLQGPDAADFQINGGVLAFKNSPDYETAKGSMDRNNDDDTDDDGEDVGSNEYTVTIRASEVRAADAEGATMATNQDITVTVTNVEEPGSIDLSRLQPQTSQPITATISDPDNVTDGTVTWQWSVAKVSRPELENDNHWTDASATTDTEAAYTPPTGAANDEGKKLRVKASYTDGEGAEKKAYKLSYHDVRAEPTGDNNAPAFDETTIAFSIPENATVGTAVGTPVSATDADQGDIITYVLGGGDAASFNINKMTGQLTNAVKLDHEAGATGSDGVYEVTVTAHDPSNATGDAREAAVTITAEDVNEAPTVGDSSTRAMTMVEEKHPVKDVVDNPDTTDVDEGATRLILGTYDSTDEDAGDGDGDTTADAREVKLSLGGEDADDFVLADPVDIAGPRELLFKASPDFESPTDANQDNAYKVTIVATDKKGLTGTKELTINVENIDEDGSVKLSTIQPGVGQEITAALTDPDMGTTGTVWQWSRAETEAGPFTDIDGATSTSYTPAAPTKDNPETLGVNEEDRGDEGKFLRVTVDYRDNASPKDDPDTTDDESEERNQTQMATSVHAVRSVPGVNRPPMFESASMMREVDENSADNADADVEDEVTADDPDGDALTYTISGGADMGAFKIPDSTTGQIVVRKGTVLDFEGSKTTFEIEVKAEDPFGKSDSTTVTITVVNVNEPPDLELRPPNSPPEFESDTMMIAVAENTAAGGYVGAPVTAMDIDGDALSYSLSGGADMDAFSIDSETGQIMVGEGTMLDFEGMQTSYMVEVMAEDPSGESDTVMVTITVTGVNEAPVFAEESVTREVAENTAAGENIGDPVAAMDPEDDTLTYSLGGDDMGSFDIDPATGQIMTSAALDYETTTSYTVMVTADDGNGESDSIMVTIGVTIAVTDVNEAPVFAGESVTREVAENTAAGENIGEPVAAMDPDAGDTLAYSLGGADAASFAIDAATGQIMVGEGTMLDFEGMQTSYMVEVTADDGNGESDSITVTITVTDVGLDNAYDMDDSGDISKEEVLDAIGDYFDDTGTSKDDVLDLIGLYFGS